MLIVFTAYKESKRMKKFLKGSIELARLIDDAVLLSESKIALEKQYELEKALWRKPKLAKQYVKALRKHELC